MKATRIYNGDDNLAHFEDIVFDMRAARAGVTETDEWEVRAAIRSFTDKEFEAKDRHPASKRALVTVASGSIELGVGNSTKRIFETGHLLFFDDLKGEGHVMSLCSPTVTLIYIQIGDTPIRYRMKRVAGK
jgi:hypothetical protein